MRHRLTTRFVVILTVLLVVAALMWTALARTVVDPQGEARTDTLFGLTGEVQRVVVVPPGRSVTPPSWSSS